MTLMCSGMAPWGGFWLNLMLVITIAPLKVIGKIIQWNFKRIVRNCAEAEGIESGCEKEQQSNEDVKEPKAESIRPRRKKYSRNDSHSD